MKFRAPDATDLMDAARSIGSALDERSARAMIGYADGFAAAFDWLEQQPDELPPIRYPQRSYRAPDPGENPLHAWYVMTDLKGNDSGPLSGRRVAIKDNIFVAGVPLRNGTGFFEGFVPEFDATVVTRLLDAGAEIAGKAVCEYLCVGGGATADSGIVGNPWNPEYSPGGSSSGSAALVGAGAVDMALGCDQAGSIRIPASWCGTVGLKPTHGLVPYSGILGMEATLDHVGPITANVADNALLLEVIAGADGLDGRQKNPAVQRYTDALGREVNGMRIGVLREGFGHPLGDADVDECVRAAAERLAALGATVREVSVPMHRDGAAVWTGIISDGLMQTLHLHGVPLHVDGVASPALHRIMRNWESHVADFPINARLLVLLGQYLQRFRGRYYAKARNLLRRLRREYEEALSECDLLLLPTTVQKPIRNPPDRTDASADAITRMAFHAILNTCQFDITGHPALSIPCGMRAGLPVGMMLVGRHFEEAAIYHAAHAFECSGDWREW
jgi:amidase